MHFVIPDSHGSEPRRLFEVGWTDEARAASLAARRKGMISEAGVAAGLKAAADAVASGRALAPDAILKALGPKDVARIQKHLDRGKVVQQEFLTAVQEIAAQHGIPLATSTEFENASLERMAAVAPIKGLARSAEKIILDYGGDVSKLGDVVRGAFVVKTPAEAHSLVQVLRQRHELMKFANHLDQPTDAGYRDANLRIRLSNGMAGEIQIQYHQMLVAKNTVGHRIYERLRALPSASTVYQSLLKRSQRVYNNAWTLTLVGMAAGSLPSGGGTGS